MKTEITCIHVHAIDCGFHIGDNCDTKCPGYAFNGIVVAPPEIIPEQIDDEQIDEIKITKKSK